MYDQELQESIERRLDDIERRDYRGELDPIDDDPRLVQQMRGGGCGVDPARDGEVQDGDE